MPRPINLTGFAGANLATNARLLPEGVGVYVVNAEPGRGDLRPLKQNLTVATIPDTPQRLSIWRMGRDVPNDANYWLSSLNVVNYTLGFGTDATEITYFTGDGTPKWTSNAIALGAPPYPQATRELAVPAPDTAATVTLDVDGDGTEAERFYVHTFVNDRGWESAPSPVSSAILCKPGATLTISNLPAAPAGSYGITLRRIYRTQPGSTNEAEFFFLREIAIGVSSTTDDARELGDLLATEGWLTPPEDGHSIVGLWGSMLAMLSGKTVHICVPGSAYAWPLRYRKNLKDTGVALATWGQNLLVLTTGNPVLFQGQDPEGMSDVQAPLSYACRSARSVVSFKHGVVWASNEGLAYTGEAGAALLTEGILTPDQWKALSPATMIAGRWGKFYVCSYSDGSKKGFVIDPLNPAGGIWFLSSGFDACHYDELADALYVLEGGSVRKFAAASTRHTATFKAKEFLQTHPVNYSHLKVVASGYPVTIKLYADGVLSETRSVTSERAVTLKRGFLKEGWQPEVVTDHDVQAVRLACDVRDLKGL